MISIAWNAFLGAVAAISSMSRLVISGDCYPLNDEGDMCYYLVITINRSWPFDGGYDDISASVECLQYEYEYILFLTGKTS